MDCKDNAEIVKKYLDANDWHYDVRDHGTAVSFTGGLGGGKSVFSSFRFQLLVEDDCIQNFVVLPVGACEKKAEIAEFIARVNYPLKRGRMDMDYRDGEIRYHICVPIAALKQDSGDVLQEVLLIPGAMLTRYGDGIAKILFGGVDPKTAYELCEGESH